MTYSISIASQDAEGLLLGRMINCAQDRKRCCELLQSCHFFYEEHTILFDALSLMNQNQKPSEIHLLLEHLKSSQLLEKTKGVDYIFSLSQSSPSPIHLESYVSILKNHWAKREALQEAKKLSSTIGESRDISSFIDNYSKKLASISKDILSSTARSFSEVSKKEGENGYLSELAFRREYYQKHGKPFIDGVPTRFESLDNLIGGLGNSNLIILASRPGMGKTALSLNFAQKIAQTHPIGIISLEMSSIQLYERILSMESAISGAKIREGKTSDTDWEKIQSLEPKISALPIFVQEGSSLIQDLVTKTRHLKQEKGIALLIIDYLQLLQSPGENRLMEISNITRELKNLAMELHIPILCLSQLSRKVEERADHRPLLSDLRESGTIEQDADVVLFLMRPDYYNERDRPDEADLSVAKNRHGQTGIVSLHFSKKFAKFDPFITEENHCDDLF